MYDTTKNLLKNIQTALYPMRLYKLFSFVYILFGILITTDFHTLLDNLAEFFTLLLFLGVFIYGSLYAINYIHDQQEDSQDPTKKNNQTVPNSKSLIIQSLVLISTGTLAIYALFGKIILAITVLLIFVNLLYTFILKSFNRLLSIFVIATTGPLKTLIGVLLISHNVPHTILTILAIHYVCSICLHIERQIKKRHITIKTRTFLLPLSLIAVGVLTYEIMMQFYWGIAVFIIGVVSIIIIQRQQSTEFFEEQKTFVQQHLSKKN